MSINDDVIPLNYDGEKLFLSISKPTKDDLDLHDCYELSSALHTPAIHPRRRSKKTMHEDIPMIEWRRCLAMAPEDIVSKTLQHTTQCYLNVDCENRSNMREHYQSRFPGLRLPQQKEGVATDTYFPSVKTSRGHTCSQMLVGLTSDHWCTQPLKTESHNGQALQDCTRQVGVPTFIKSDNAQSETGTTWTDHCRDFALAPKRLNQVILGKTHASTESARLLTWSRLTLSLIHI